MEKSMDMIEKVARALYAQRGYDLPWGKGNAYDRVDCFGDAAVAIEALREPTPQMQSAGRDATAFSARIAATQYGSAGKTWQAMIDAALNK